MITTNNKLYACILLYIFSKNALLCNKLSECMALWGNLTTCMHASEYTDNSAVWTATINLQQHLASSNYIIIHSVQLIQYILWGSLVKSHFIGRSLFVYSYKSLLFACFWIHRKFMPKHIILNIVINFFCLHASE